MERRQGTIDQVFRARKRKHTSPITPSSKSKKNSHERVLEEELEISPPRKGSLEAFFCNAVRDDPSASSGGRAGANSEPELPELRRGEVKFSSNKPWLTPCSLASRPPSAEAIRDDPNKDTGSFDRTDGDRGLALSALDSQIIESSPSPERTELICSQNGADAKNNIARESIGMVVEVATGTKTDLDKKLDGASTNHLSQFANDFLSLCFSGISTSKFSKPQAAELLQQKRKDDEGLPENAGRKKLCPELISTHTIQGLADVQVSTGPKKINSLSPGPGRSSFDKVGDAKGTHVERHVRSREYCADLSEDDDPSKGNSRSTALNHGALSRGAEGSHVRENSHNFGLSNERPPAGSSREIACIAQNHECPADARMAGFKFDPGGAGLGIKHECTPPENVLTQLRNAAASSGEERLSDKTTVSRASDFSTPSAKDHSRPSPGREAASDLVTPEPCSENKHSSTSAHEHNAGGSYYRSSLFSPGDEFWEEAIGIVMASKIDILNPSAVDKTNPSSSPGKLLESDAQLPKSARGGPKFQGLSSHGHVLSRQHVYSSSAKAQSTLSNDPEWLSTSGRIKALKSELKSAEDGRDQSKVIKSRTPSDCLQKTTPQGAGFETRLKQFSTNSVSPLPVRHFDFASKGEIPDHRKFQDLGQEKNSILLAKQPLKGEARTMKTNAGDVATAVGEVPLEDNHRITAEVVFSVGEARKGVSEEIGAGGNAMPAADTQTKAVTGAGKEIASSDVLPQGASKVPSDLSSGVPIDQRNLELSDWLPKEVAAVYAKKKLTHLYPWQLECIQLEGVLDGRNLVYSASTSAGKSLVAELLMIRRVVSTQRMALLVLPFVSICSEKAEHLEAVLEPIGKRVRNFFGALGSATVPKDTSVAVCTIEKANSLINRLLEENRLCEVCSIVIDELHMVGDRERGYLLELLLTKIRYACGEFDKISGASQEQALANALSQSTSKGDPKADLQIIGMSATLPNMSAVGQWLQAEVYETVFRPVPLEELVKVGNTIYNPKMEIVRTIRREADMGGKDPDHVVELCYEVVREGHSVLVFCGSRRACETSAIHIAKYLPLLYSQLRNGNTGLNDGYAAIEELRKSSSGLDPVLAQTLPYGVAYHHAGLTVEEREVVERCFKQGVVRVLTATSTLAAGVNLPARRVIFRTPKIGRDFLDATRYRQMAGRAGRAGIDTKGESVLLCKPEEVKRMLSVLSEGCQPLQSCLIEEKSGMMRALLEVVAGGIVRTPQDVNRYVRCTFFNSTQLFDQVVKSVMDSLRWLCRKKFVEWTAETQVYSTTPLGRAAFGCSLSPEDSLVVFEDLAKARDGFVLSSDLHLVYQVTPIYVELEPDWSLFYQKFVELSQLEQAVGARVGVVEPFLMRMAHGASMGSAGKLKGNSRSPPNRGTTSPALHGTVEGKFTGRHQTVDALRVCRRFYVAMILSRLVQEVPLMEVSDAFKVPRGTVQSLQANAGRFAAMVSGFCERLGWHDLEGLISKFQSRVSFGVRSEIVELTEIPFVKGARARALYKSGFRTVQAVAEATVPELSKALSEASAWAAQDDPRRHTQQRMLAGVVRKVKAGAQRIVLERAEEARIAAFSAIRALGVDVPSALWPPIQTSIAVATAVADTDDLEDSFETVAVKNEHLGGESCPAVDIASNSVANNRATNHMRNTGKGDGPEQKDNENQVRGKFQDIPLDGRGANIESVLQKYKKAAGSTLSLNCLFGGADLLKSLDEDICNRPGTAERIDHGPIDVDKMKGGFDAFFQQWRSVDEFCFDLYYKNQSAQTIIQRFDIEGVAICWKHSPVYYVSLSKSSNSGSGKEALCGNLLEEKIVIADNKAHAGHAFSQSGSELSALDSIELRWKNISSVLSRNGPRKLGWDLKNQLRALCNAGISQPNGKLENAAPRENENNLHSLSPIFLGEPYVDVHIVSWLLWPDEESSQNLSLEQEVKKRLPGEVAAEASRAGRWTNQMGGVSFNGCCRRVAQIQALHSALWKRLISEGLHHPLLAIEMPMVKVLAEMESSGIGVDMDAFGDIRQVTQKRIRGLEARAHQLAGTSFALSVPADVANTLYKHLKLPVPPGCKKGKQHPSANKHALDLLRHQHPIAAVIQEHRKLSKLLHSTLASIDNWAKSPSPRGAVDVKTTGEKMHQIFGTWLQTSTATGRLAMEEPNLQCVENTIYFSKEDGFQEDGVGANNDKVVINTRQLFVPSQEKWVILSADYSQIELRLMAHFSEDAGLIALLSKPSGDLFRMITSQWTGNAETAVTDKQREQTKRLVYGILYGMGVQALAEQLDCSIAEASLNLEKFRSAFPGVHAWLQQACVNCHKSGYVTTLGGRKRFLDKINSGANAEQAKAERQAVNSICQGSAADLIKMAMIKLHAAITCDVVGNNLSTVKGRCRLLLQIHDELVLEVDRQFVKEVSQTLRACMEGAAPLKVPLRVNFQVGKTWGSLNPLDESSMAALIS
ncbi:unnamed protein product [Calypogeia fissa]